MDEREVMELLQLAFEYAQDTDIAASCLDGWRRDVPRLVAVAHDERVPFPLRAWAYEALCELAREYRKADPENVPRALYIWSLGVASGEIQPPARQRGRDRSGNIMRNHVTAEMVSWLRCELGYTREAAVGCVARALHVSTDAVETILRNLSKK